MTRSGAVITVAFVASSIAMAVMLTRTEAPEQTRVADETPTADPVLAPGTPAVCEALGCDAELQIRVNAILAELEGDRRDPNAVREAHEALARHIRDRSLTTQDLEARIAEQGEQIDTRATHAAEALERLYALVDAAQRNALADLVEQRGLGVLVRAGGRRRRPSSNFDWQPLCEHLGCTPAQQQVVQHVEDEALQSTGAREAADGALRTLCEAFRKPGFSNADVTAFRVSIHPERLAAERQHVELLLQLQAILDDDQRHELAALLEERGLRGLREPE